MALAAEYAIIVAMGGSAQSGGLGGGHSYDSRASLARSIAMYAAGLRAGYLPSSVSRAQVLSPAPPNLAVVKDEARGECK